MSTFIQGFLSAAGQCQEAKDAPNFCSGMVSIMVFTLIFQLKLTAHKLDKGFVVGEYFCTGTFECWWALSSG